MINGPEEARFDAGEDGLWLEVETRLRQELRHEDPPAGFADRVMAQARSVDDASPATGKLLHWSQRRLWLTGVIAAALVAGVFEGQLAYKRMREEQRRIIDATRQFETTERITVRALAQAREQLQHAGVPLSLD